MKASGMTVQEYRSRLDEHKGLITELSGDWTEGRLQGFSVKDPVAASLFLSIDQISRDNAFATDCLCLAACVDRKDISLDLLEAVSTPAREDAIRILDKYALVTRRPAESALDVHRLVHEALRKRLQVQGQLQEWTKRTIKQLLRVFPDDDHSNRSKWRRLLPHAQYALSHSPADDDKERMRLASKCATTLFRDGRYDEAEELFVQVMQTSKRMFTDEHPDTLSSMHNLAFTLRTQARHEEALALIERCFQLREQVLGEQHTDTQSSLYMLSDWRAEYR